MPDIELFKIILNGGMFGLWLLFVVWCLWYGAPMLQKTLEKISSDSKAALSDLSKECREERREIMSKAAEEREEDRKSRHELANQMQNVIRDAIRIPPPR